MSLLSCLSLPVDPALAPPQPSGPLDAHTGVPWTIQLTGSLTLGYHSGPKPPFPLGHQLAEVTEGSLFNPSASTCRMNYKAMLLTLNTCHIFNVFYTLRLNPIVLNIVHNSFSVYSFSCVL